MKQINKETGKTQTDQLQAGRKSLIFVFVSCDRFLQFAVLLRQIGVGDLLGDFERSVASSITGGTASSRHLHISCINLSSP